METINEQLKTLYLKTFGDSFEKCSPIKEKILKRPLLIKFANENAIKNEEKLSVMFFLQETSDWKKDGTVCEDMETYCEFFNDFSEYTQPPVHPYWKTQKYTWLVLEEMRNTINKQVFGKPVIYIWNNIVKSEYNIGDSAKIPDDVYAEFRNLNCKLILGEIEIIKPDVLVFFTGPNIYYDKKIDDVFNNGKKIDKKVTDKGVNINTLAEMRLPYHGNSYITYHPLYLGRNAKPKKGIVLSAIAEQCAAVAM